MNSKYTNFIVEYKAGERETVLSKLVDYDVRASSLVDIISVRVVNDKVPSLLETLAEINGITYRQALPRRALTNMIDETILDVSVANKKIATDTKEKP